MERITKYKGPWWIPGMILFAIALILFLSMLVSPANAEMYFYGSVPNYSAVVLPNDSYVHQGQNISQGNYYDLRGVYGFSGELAHWDNDNSAGIGKPDQIVTLTGGRFSTYIDPATFPVGRWWQWDGSYCPVNSDSCSIGFGHGNAYAFYVTPELQDGQESLRERVIVQTSEITIFQNGSAIKIPVTYTQIQTYYTTPEPTQEISGSGTIMVTPTETPEPTPIPNLNPDIQDQNGVSIPGGVSGATVVTQKSPVPVVVPVLAVIGIMLVMRRRE